MAILETLSKLVPSKRANAENDPDFSDLLLGKVDEFKVEYSNRKALKSSSVDKLTASRDLKTVLQAMNRVMFPRIHKLLQISSVIPISAASGKRSFSVLKRLKFVLDPNHLTNALPLSG